jgi:uncharacterized membrane protein
MRNNTIYKELQTLREVLNEIILLLKKQEEILNRIYINKRLNTSLNSNEEMECLPNSLQKTVRALVSLGGSGTAKQISQITNRPRVTESRNLNKLVDLCWVAKRREKDKYKGSSHVVFYLGT